LLVILGALLCRLGRSAEGLPTAEEGVAIYRELAVAKPDPYRAELATSLSILGDMLSESGRSAEAVSMTEEEIAIHRELAIANPYRYLPRLASSLTDLSTMLYKIRRSAEARSAIEESEAIDRQLVAVLPDHNRARLADFTRTYLHMLEEPDPTSEEEPGHLGRGAPDADGAAGRGTGAGPRDDRPPPAARRGLLSD
jgi:hypothetical protein